MTYYNVILHSTTASLTSQYLIVLNDRKYKTWCTVKFSFPDLFPDVVTNLVLFSLSVLPGLAWMLLFSWDLDDAPGASLLWNLPWLLDCAGVQKTCGLRLTGKQTGCLRMHSHGNVLARPETRSLNAFAREKLETSAETIMIPMDQEPSITFGLITMMEIGWVNMGNNSWINEPWFTIPLL